MDSYTSVLAGSGTIGAIVILIIAFLKCCEKKKYKSHSGCIDFEVEADLNAKEGATAPQIIQIQTPVTPTNTPVLESRRVSTTAVVGLKLDEEKI